jgi:Flp pilus assembly protein TadG
MTQATTRKRRAGAMAAEAAIVLPVLLFMLLAIVVGGLGVFRHQLVVCQAREAARYVSVRGADWQSDMDVKMALSADEVVQKVVLPLAQTMDASQLTVTVEWVNQGTGVVKDWDASPRHVKSLNAVGEYVTNTVRVTVRYHWVPEFFLGACDLRSVCELPMCN